MCGRLSRAKRFIGITVVEFLNNSRRSVTRITADACIDHQFTVTFIAMGVVFVLAQCTLGLFAWQYRDRGSASKVEYSHGNTKLEVLWTTLTAILFIGLNLMGSPIWAA